MHFCWIFVYSELCRRCFNKGAGHWSFRRVIWNNYYGKVLMIYFINTLTNLLKNLFFLFAEPSKTVMIGQPHWKILLIVRTLHICLSLSTGGSTKAAAYCSFGRVFQNNYLEKVLLVNFIIDWNNLLKHSIFTDSLMMVNHVQDALRKKLRIAPFLEPFQRTKLGKPYWWILSALGTIHLVP